MEYVAEYWYGPELGPAEKANAARPLALVVAVPELKKAPAEYWNVTVRPEIPAPLITSLSVALAMNTVRVNVETAGGIATLASVPGRFQLASTPDDDVTVVVDYAHTDDALRNLLETARPLTTGRVITVFGCGGDRDRTKRPRMGRVASELADFSIITSDNPRGEDPAAIIREVVPGFLHKNFEVVVDREKAITRALALAKEGDIVLLAGKGHETYQEIMGVKHHFDDREEALLAYEKNKDNIIIKNKKILILHRGKIGGGKSGVGKNLFIDNFRVTEHGSAKDAIAAGNHSHLAQNPQHNHHQTL